MRVFAGLAELSASWAARNPAARGCDNLDVGKLITRLRPEVTMSRVKNILVVPPQLQTRSTPETAAPRSATKSAPANLLRTLERDAFEGASHLLQKLGVKDAGEKLAPVAKGLGFEVADEDAGRIDNDGMVVPNADGKKTDAYPAGSAPSGSSSPTDVKYYGGKVLKNFDVQNVYYGSYWNTAQGKADAQYNDGFMKDLVKNKDVGSIWHQYGVASGTTESSTVASKSVRSGQTVSQRSIESLVKKLAANDPNAGNNKIFNVVLPPDAVLSQGGATSKQGLGGYHGSVTVNGKQVYYSAICYSKGSNGIDFTHGNSRDNISITESHEISEAVTDPDVEVASKTNNWGALGWMDPKNGEIGDMEVNDAAPGTPLSTMYGRTDGYAVQKIWSQEDGTNEIRAKHPGAVQPLPTPTKA